MLKSSISKNTQLLVLGPKHVNVTTKILVLTLQKSINSATKSFRYRAVVTYVYQQLVTVSVVKSSSKQDDMRDILATRCKRFCLNKVNGFSLRI